MTSPSMKSIARQDPWIVRHWQQVLLALAAGGVAVVLSTVVVSQLEKARGRAWEQFSFAQSQVSQGNRAAALGTLTALLTSQRAGPIAVQALLLKSDVLLADGKKDEALAAVQEALRQAPSPDYKALVSMSLAYVLEENGKPAEAAAQYAAFIKDHPDHFMLGRAYALLGRLQKEQGRWAEAQTTLEKLVTLYPSSVWAKDAKASLDEIKKQLVPKK